MEYYIYKSLGNKKFKNDIYLKSHGTHSRSIRNWNQNGFVKKQDKQSHHAKRNMVRNIMHTYKDNITELSVTIIPVIGNIKHMPKYRSIYSRKI